MYRHQWNVPKGISTVSAIFLCTWLHSSIDIFHCSILKNICWGINEKEIKISPLSKTNHPMGNTFSNLNCHRIDNNKNYILYTILKAHLIFYPTNFLFYHIFIPAKTKKKRVKKKMGKKKKMEKKKRKANSNTVTFPRGYRATE